MSRGVCAVTGASGYVGARLCEHLAEDGWQVVRLGRRDGDEPFSLGDPLSPDVLRRRAVSALVHCAYDFSARSWPEIERINVQGSLALLAAARAASVPRVVLISSAAAFDGCKSLYGRAKLEIERAFAAEGAFVIRPGLVYGGATGGLVGTMARVMAKLPVVPVIGARERLHCCHVDDLGALVVRLCAGSERAPAAAIAAAAEESIAFVDILKRLAPGRRRLFVPVPWRFAWAGLKAIETVGIRIGLRSDSVVSLANQNPAPDFSTARALGVPFRSL